MSHSTSRFIDVLLPLALVVVVLIGLHLLGDFFSASLVALVLAQVMIPLVGSLRRRGWNYGAALAAVILLALVSGAALVALVGISLAQAVRVLPQYADRVAAVAEDASAAGVDPAAARSALIDATASLVPAIGHVVGVALMALVIFAFMLYESDRMPARLSSAGPMAGSILRGMTAYNIEVRRFLMINGLLGSLAGALIAVFLWFVGVDFPFLWGVLVALLNFVPAVGLLIAAIPPIVLAYLEFGLVTALVVVVGIVLITNVVAQIMKPKYYGEGLNLSRLVIILSVVVWGTVVGPVGALFSVPLTLLVKAVLEAFDETRWLAVVMSGQTTTTQPAGTGAASVPLSVQPKS
jgi:AI-2 transport protein TqsA